MHGWPAEVPSPTCGLYFEAKSSYRRHLCEITLHMCCSGCCGGVLAVDFVCGCCLVSSLWSVWSLLLWHLAIVDIMYIGGVTADCWSTLCGNWVFEPTRHSGFYLCGAAQVCLPRVRAFKVRHVASYRICGLWCSNVWGWSIFSISSHWHLLSHLKHPWARLQYDFPWR